MVEMLQGRGHVATLELQTLGSATRRRYAVPLLPPQLPNIHGAIPSLTCQLFHHWFWCPAMLFAQRRAEPCVSMRSVSSAPMATEALAGQDAALGALRPLDAHICSIAFHASSPHAHSAAPLPPQFLTVVPPTAVLPLASKSY